MRGPDFSKERPSVRLPGQFRATATLTRIRQDTFNSAEYLPRE
jgi:hypothetical protein